MTQRLVVRAGARDDIRSAREWYERESPALGDRFAATLVDAIARIREQPLTHPRVHGDIRRALMRPFRHAVYFRARTDEIVILGVIHASRDPTTWRGRR